MLLIKSEPTLCLPGHRLLLYCGLCGVDGTSCLSRKGGAHPRDGYSFDAERRLQQKAGTQEGYGLRGIRERIELVGGTFHLESQAGRGTQLSVTVTRTGMATPGRWDTQQRVAISEQG